MKMIQKYYRPAFSGKNQYTHPNHEGTGNAVRFIILPAYEHTEGAVVMQIAMQNSITKNKDKPTFPTFDWDNKIAVKFTRDDIAEILRVLTGIKEAANGGKGIFHRTARANTIIKFSRVTVAGTSDSHYSLSVSRKNKEGELSNAHIRFDPVEGLCLKVNFEQALFYVCHGLPYMKEFEISESDIYKS